MTGAGRYQDSVYDHNAPGARQYDAGYSFTRPGYDSNEERLTEEALLRALAGQPAPAARVLFPPRFVGERTQPNLSDLINLNRSFLDPAGFTGTNGGYTGTQGPSLGWW